MVEPLRIPASCDCLGSPRLRALGQPAQHQGSELECAQLYQVPKIIDIKAEQRRRKEVVKANNRGQRGGSSLPESSGHCGDHDQDEIGKTARSNRKVQVESHPGKKGDSSQGPAVAKQPREWRPCFSWRTRNLAQWSAVKPFQSQVCSSHTRIPTLPIRPRYS